MTCDDFKDESRVIEQGHASPEMVERHLHHKATCVNCGGVMPSHVDLRQIFRDMFARVGHPKVCRDQTCKHDDDPPSLFESEVVKQFVKES